MKVLVACEFSGIVRDAFISHGHEAMSCDLLETERPGPHYCGDVRDVLGRGWDLMVAHPPCTYIAVSGMHWTVRGFRDPQLTEDALDFVRLLLGAPVGRIALENPVSVISSRIRRPEQIIQPWQFGHPESKATCLWLKNLPKLVPTDILPLPEGGRWLNQFRGGQNAARDSRGKLYGWNDPAIKLARARTYSGIAEAMALQWGSL